MRNVTEYLDSERWEGKSGGYGVQDGDPFVTVTRGSFSNVVGLPIERLETLIQQVLLVVRIESIIPATLWDGEATTVQSERRISITGVITWHLA